MTDVAALTVPAEMVNVAEVAPCATVTLAGTLAADVFELDSETTAPPEGAAPVNVTVPVADPPLATLLELTLTALSAAGGGLIVTGKVSLTPAYEAVKVTAVGLVTLPAPSVKLAEVDPCGIVTLDGIVASAGDELKAIVAPPLGAVAVTTTVQVVVDGGVIDTELHENWLRPNGVIVTLPPMSDTGSPEPPASDASLLVSCSADDASVVELDTVRETVANTPVAMGVSLEPQTIQVRDPAVVLHAKLLPAPVAADPAVSVADEKSAVE